MIQLVRASRAVRLVSLIAMSSWLAIGDAGLAHSCPTHRDGETASSEHSAPLHADHSLGHDAPAAPEHHAECTCVGQCSTVSGVLVPRASNEEIGLVVVDEPAEPASAIQLARRVAHYSLPYSNGPPGARLVS